DTSEARIVAERLRAAVAAAPLACSEVEHGIAITVSIGVASCPTDGTTPSQIQEQADQAMYWAKRLGRNRVCTVAEATIANSDAQLKMATTHMLQRQEVTMLDTCHPEQPLWAAQLGLIYALMGALDTRESGMGKRTHEMSDLITSLARSVAEALAEVQCRGGTQIDPALLPVMQDVLFQQLEEHEAPRKSTRHLASSAS
ncbi:MAG TPA: diguanylate cyclase, partial [Ktedonobacteraceae bacterium]|nr:diguanylate cyclase [Ktedonobacteraceae bacterium]